MMRRKLDLIVKARAMSCLVCANPHHETVSRTILLICNVRTCLKRPALLSTVSQLLTLKLVCTVWV